ncbi:MAG: class I SAM-dependent methyltransferase [Candidatus Obscuribacterales bacterium]
MIYAPGSILQHMYLRERLAKRPPGRFLEIGSGRGAVTRILLELGWTGVGYDLNPDALTEATEQNHEFIEAKKLQLICADWLSVESSGKFDLIISCFVLEHLDDKQEQNYLDRCSLSLTEHGIVALMVPSSPKHWSLEDDVAGHYRRYDKKELVEKLAAHGLSCNHVVGLNYPLTNLLQPLARMILKLSRFKEKVASKSAQERTVSSGNWKVPMLTTFPGFLSIVLNETVMKPFFWMQNGNHDNTNCLVTYMEASHTAK